MSTDDRTVRLSTVADEHPTERFDTTAVLTDARPAPELTATNVPPRPASATPPVPSPPPPP
ncbi:hypothetical protein, partial [Rathayibacter iranicus]|uniref:hypothetical protein n=1 Tax=Rathayibacter iranicus TaxID=59737 RepID=UPI000D4D274B